MLVIVSFTDLFLYFLHLFGKFIQLVPILFTPVQLCIFLNFFGKFYMLFLQPAPLWIMMIYTISSSTLQYYGLAVA